MQKIMRPGFSLLRCRSLQGTCHTASMQAMIKKPMVKMVKKEIEVPEEYFEEEPVQSAFSFCLPSSFPASNNTLSLHHLCHG